MGHRAASGGLFFVASLIVLVAAIVEPQPLPAAAPPSTATDPIEIAELNDVFFLDPDRGWAVGERGAILETRNGGRSWQTVDSPTTARLESISFVDELHGWIVGGSNTPHTYTSSAIVLRTENGGRKWIRQETPTLPALRWVRFHNTRQGWAVGGASTIDPVGVFRSDDGGHAWQSVPGPEKRSMMTAAISENGGLVCAGRDSTMWLCSGNQLRPAAAPMHPLRSIRAIDLDGRTGWCVGDGGLLFCTRDGGATWQPPRRPLPDGATLDFDLRTVDVLGESCWIAGAPGTCIYHSPDFGATWQKYRTGVLLPINRLRFLDQQHGWAVGVCGSILSTHDAGRTWRVQRQGGRRMALAAMFGMAEDVPWELIARAASDEGQYASVNVLYRPHSADDSETTFEDRCREATASVGAQACQVAWSFPVDFRSPPGSFEHVAPQWAPGLATRGLPPHGLPGREDAETSDRNHVRLAIDRMEEYLVRQIRSEHPDVIVTDRVSPDGSRPLSHLASQIVLRAVQRAADPSAYPDQILVSYLEPWSVKKVYTLLPAGQRGTLSVDTDRIAIHLGCTLADYAVVARGLVSSSWMMSPPNIELRLVTSEVAEEPGRRELFGGVMTDAIGESRRAISPTSGNNLDSLSHVIRKQRQLQGLAADSDLRSSPDVSLVAELDEMTLGLSPHYAGVMLYRTAQQFASKRDFGSTAAVLTGLVERYPQHVLAEASLVWLMQFHASDELQHITGIASPDRLESLLRLGQRLQQTRLALYQDASVQFLLVSSQRRWGEEKEADRLLQFLANSPQPFAWRTCARAEQWLSNPMGRIPRPILECREVQSKPYLDARLDDSIWQQAETVELKSPGEESKPATQAMLTHDAEFLYLAVRCPKDPACTYKVVDAPRSRDTEMGQQDHIDILLDVDRDYVTCYRLSVDHRGWTRDDCCGDSRWNPQWHVAAAGNESEWIIEAAVPLAELESHQEGPRQPWVFGIQRVLPDGRLQAWSNSPSPVIRPEGSGYLVFP